MLTVAIVVLSSKYYVRVKRLYTCVLKGAKYKLFSKHLLLQLLEEHKEFTLRHA